MRGRWRTFGGADPSRIAGFFPVGGQPKKNGATESFPREGAWFMLLVRAWLSPALPSLLTRRE